MCAQVLLSCKRLSSLLYGRNVWVPCAVKTWYTDWASRVGRCLRTVWAGVPTFQITDLSKRGLLVYSIKTWLVISLSRKRLYKLRHVFFPTTQKSTFSKTTPKILFIEAGRIRVECNVVGYGRILLKTAVRCVTSRNRPSERHTTNFRILGAGTWFWWTV